MIEAFTEVLPWAVLAAIACIGLWGFVGVVRDTVNRGPR